MKIEIELTKTNFEKAIIKEIARQILTGETRNSRFLSFSSVDPIKKILLEKANVLLRKDPEFEKKIMKDIKSQMNNKGLITSIAREVLKEKLDD